MKTLALVFTLIATVFTATPALAYIDAFPSFLNFGDTVVGRRSFSQSVTVTNRGQEDISYINVSPSCGITFDVSSGSCFGPLRANQSCYVNVTFSPIREGYESCSIYVSSSQGSASISASGRGVKSNSPLSARKPRLVPKRK
jgi:hypothetical protein